MFCVDHMKKLLTRMFNYIDYPLVIIKRKLTHPKWKVMISHIGDIGHTFLFN